MQSDYKQIYKLTSQKTGKPEQVYKDIGNFVFANLLKNIKRPKTLIIKLKGVGSWYLGKTKMEKKVNDFDPDKPVRVNEWAESLGIFPHENKIEMINIFKDRLKDYEEYLDIRNEVREKRYKNQKLIKDVNSRPTD